MRINLLKLLSFVQIILWLRQKICNTVSSSSQNTSTVSNIYLEELDDYLPQFISGNLSVKEQVDFIQTVIDFDLVDRYDLHQECKYFVLEGFCTEIPLP
jgi:hypothetical protein